MWEKDLLRHAGYCADSPQIKTVLTLKKPDRMLQYQFFDSDKPKRASTCNKNKY
ncbi:hypothetical protein JCM10003_3054 [Bacteroides pyogenes JCM 10003]|nr:hypothetical protein JCM10003_3054 [Bacteroides pyogenes JCM 10003]